MREEFERAVGRQRGRPREQAVVLTNEEREKLLQVVAQPLNEFERWRARVLIAMDRGQSGGTTQKSHAQIALECGVSESSVYRTGKRFLEQGLEATLNAKTKGKPFAAKEEQAILGLIENYNRKSVLWTARGIARTLDRSPAAVCRALRRLEIEFP